TTIMPGDALALVPELDFGGVHFGLHFASHRSRNRIEVRQHPRPAAAAPPREGERGELETFSRQWQQILPLQTHARSHAVAALADDPLLVPLRCLQQKQGQLPPRSEEQTSEL